MDLLLCAEDSEAELRAELADAIPGVRLEARGPLLFELESDLAAGGRAPYLAFARQWYPRACAVKAGSIRGWATELFEQLVPVVPAGQPWLLHIEPHYGARSSHHIGARAWHSRLRQGALPRPAGEPPRGPDPAAGRHRCRLIREALLELLRQKRRHLLRGLGGDAAPFAGETSLVQLLLTGPEEGFFSAAVAPVPFEQRHLLSPFPKGELPVASDKAAPSRAFAKLVEAEQRLGRAIGRGDRCVDLGAAPGSWTYVAVERGAQVVAVDRSALRADLMEHARVRFHAGDAFRFVPEGPVDWLLCDVIAEPERTAALVLNWVRSGWCRQWVVTLKLREESGAGVLSRLKRQLAPLAGELRFTRLCANKKEVCVTGALS